MDEKFTYIIAGGGLAGASAVKGIREVDPDGPILLVGRERHLPYHRPPLSKKLWSGNTSVNEVFIEDQSFYDKKGVELVLGNQASVLDANRKSVTLATGKSYRFDKLLLATGGTPRVLDIPGGELEGIYYYRYLDHFQELRAEATRGRSVLVIGGGFIGSEMAAALNVNGLDVTMIFPESYLVQRIFPVGLGQALQSRYRERGVRILPNDVPAAIRQQGSRFMTRTRNGEDLQSDLVLAGIGIHPSVELGKQIGLKIDDGIIVNEYLQTSHPDIYAAGDNARFPYTALGRLERIEHWDNAKHQGLLAGRNMAGHPQEYTYLPYFFSDLFEFGYEAVGRINSELETHADWEEENVTGVIYYLEDGQVQGVVACNIWKKLDQAREIIRQKQETSPPELSGMIV
jgi:3-phenylpropionate/trans-cinnamate dioxygenase ferredoxin reductase component